MCVKDDYAILLHFIQYSCRSICWLENTHKKMECCNQQNIQMVRKMFNLNCIIKKKNIQRNRRKQSKNDKLWRTDINILYLWRDIPLLCMHKKSLIWTKFTQIFELLICYCTYNFETVHVYSYNLTNSKFLSANV